MRSFVLVACLALGGAGVAVADPLPAIVTVPAKPSTDVVFEKYGHAEFKLPDGADGKDAVLAGRHWSTRLDTSVIAGDEPAKFAAVLAALKKGGWVVMLASPDWHPPYLSMKLVKNGKETWLGMWITADDTSLELVEKGDPTVKLSLTAPTDGIAKVADTADFPFLKSFPGAKLEKTEHDDSPFYFTLETGKDPEMIASGTVIKHYILPANTSGLEEAVVYRDALKAAGWTIMEMNDAVTTGDPNVTAHYAKGAVDLWVHVHAGGMVQVADAGAERGSAKMKAELDKSCKVAVYGVNFDFDKATLRKDAKPALDAIAKLLTDFKDLKVELGGHTDNAGEHAYNQKLSEQRVGTVKTWLVKNAKVAADRLTTKGYAETAPVVPNDSPQNMAKNRRVELKKLDCKAK